MSVQTSTDTDPWRARIRDVAGATVGAGIVVSHHHVLTCAHVVARALATSPEGRRPSGWVDVDFPVAVEARRSAAVIEDGWIPQYPDGRGDLALLALAESVPESVRPARLGRYRDVGNREVRAYGHPGELPDGVWATARLVGYGGPGGELVQLDGRTVPGRRIEGGFSGAGAHEGVSGCVVGIVVSHDTDLVSKVAWMVPMEDVRRYLPVVGPGGAGAGSGAGAGPSDRPTDGPRRSPTVSAPQPRRPRTTPSPMRRPPYHLTTQEQAELVDRLSAVPGMNERAARTMCLDMLARQLTTPVPVQRQSDETLDLWAILGALLERPGSLRAFVGLLRRVHRDSREVLDLEALVERAIPDLLLEHEERAALLDLLAGVPWARISTAYRHATEGHWLQQPLERSGTADVVRRLELYGRTHGGPPPPVLAFAEDVAHALGGLSSAQLHRWTDAVAERLGVARVEIEALCSRTTERGPGSGEAAVVVVVEPDPIDDERFLLSLWQHVDGEDQVVLRDDRSRTLAEIRRVVDDELRRVPEAADTEEELTVEFVLPSRLLGEPVEDWTFDRSGFPRPLGIHYPVVVRHLERLRGWRRYDAWRRKSRYLAEHGHRVGAVSVRCLESGPGEVDRLQLFAELVGDERIAGLAVAFPPEPRDTGPGAGGHGRTSDEFTAAVEAGLPCVVWSREPSDPGALCGLVQTWVEHDGLLALPTRVRDHRRARQAEPAGRQATPAVGLVHDLGTRIPPGFRSSVRLRAPQ